MISRLKITCFIYFLHLLGIWRCQEEDLWIKEATQFGPVARAQLSRQVWKVVLVTKSLGSGAVRNRAEN